MKLVELLAKEIDKWPENVVRICQSLVDSELYGDNSNGSCIFQLYPESGGNTPISEDGYDYVSRAQWQAERDKQNGGEWKRHRGGKQPVADDVVIEYKTRSGYTDTWSAKSLSWSHEGGEGDLMQYRVISQPQAEEVEVTKPELTYKLDWVEVDDTKPVANPLAWRDTIIHCQAIIEDCEREIERNVALLDSEGLLMQLEPKKGMQAYDVDMGDWRNWKAGDVVTVHGNQGGYNRWNEIDGSTAIIDSIEDSEVYADGLCFLPDELDRGELRFRHRP